MNKERYQEIRETSNKITEETVLKYLSKKRGMKLADVSRAHFNDNTVGQLICGNLYSPSGVYYVMKRLIQQGKVRKDGKKYWLI